MLKQITNLKWRVAVVVALIQVTASVSMAARANTNSQNSAGNWTAKRGSSSSSDTAGKNGNCKNADKKMAKAFKQFLKEKVKNDPEFNCGINLGEYESDEIINWLNNHLDLLEVLMSQLESGTLESENLWPVYKGWRAWALADSDGDGMTNGDELLALTDPDDDMSAVTLELIKSPEGDDLVSWDAQSTCTYALEGSNDLMSGEWTTVVDGLIGDQTIDWELPVDNHYSYYRLQVSR